MCLLLSLWGVSSLSFKPICKKSSEYVCMLDLCINSLWVLESFVKSQESIPHESFQDGLTVRWDGAAPGVRLKACSAQFIL